MVPGRKRKSSIGRMSVNLEIVPHEQNLGVTRDGPVLVLYMYLDPSCISQGSNQLRPLVVDVSLTHDEVSVVVK